MNGETPETRYHAEVKINIEGHEVRVNCSADSLEEILKDIDTISSRFPAPKSEGPAISRSRR